MIYYFDTSIYGPFTKDVLDSTIEADSTMEFDNDFQDILNLPIYDKDYVGKYFSKKELKEKQKLEIKLQKQKEKQKVEEQHKQIIYNLINNSGIDFTKSGWSKKCIEYLLNRNEMFNKGIFRMIRKYYPEFLQKEDVWKRKGSII